jgi:hypothetical protein
MTSMTAAIFTICSRNYLGQAITLMQSVREHEPRADRYIVLVDRKEPEKQVEGDIASVIWIEDLGIADLEYRALIFDVLELNTNIKPTVLRHLLRQYSHCVYLDPDTLLYSPLDPVWVGLQNNNIVVTPHLLRPLSTREAPWDQDILRHGSFNLGFIGTAAGQETDRLLAWWEERCLTCGFNAPADGFFVDQKFMDHAHCYFEGVKVLRHSGLNIAYWNLHERPLSQSNGRWMVGTEPLIFMHFSGFIFSPKPEEANLITKNQSRVSLETRPELAAIFNDYRARLNSNRYGELSQARYSFDHFDNGAPITRFARRLIGSGAVEITDLTRPLSATGEAYRILKTVGALPEAAPLSRPPSRDRTAEKLRLLKGMRILGWFYRRLGVARYEALLKFLAYAGSTLNQRFVVRR